MSSTGSTSGKGLGSMFAMCLANPDLATCDYAQSYYRYRLSLAANATFLGLFSLSLLAFLGVYAATRRGLAFTLAMMLGLLCEILGYAGRVMSWQNQWKEIGFLMQICCLTIGPAFMAAGIYFCLRRIVYAFGPENSRIRPEWYTRIFIPCDVVSLVLQATGGGLASVASHSGRSVDLGDNIMIAGLTIQVVTLLIFMVCCADFALSVRRRHAAYGAAAFDQSGAARSVRGSALFKGCLAALALATVCIFWRSVFRVAELAKGWSGPLMGRQDLFIGFEGVMVVVAVLALNLFHPSICFGELMTGAGGIGSRKSRNAARSALGSGKGDSMNGRSEPASDVELGSSPYAR